MLCAICDRTNATMRLCAACKADPVNEGLWSEGDGFTVGDVEAELARVGAAHARLAEAMQRKPRVPSALKGAILRDAMTLTGDYYIDKLGYRHRRWRARTTREIAKRNGCNQSTVVRCVNRQLGR